MRVSIWQQFSSNHSSSVTIVGRFVSPTAASEAAAQLDAILKDVSAWWSQHHDPDQPFDPFGPPSASEVELLRKYDLPTERSFLFTPDVRASLSTTVLDQTVCVRIGETLNEPPTPVRHLIQQLGGQEVAVNFEINGDWFSWVSIHLTCTAPDATTADAISKNPWGGDEGMIGTCQREGEQLVYEMVIDDFIDGFPAFLAILRAQGCANIAYTLAESSNPIGLAFWNVFGVKQLLSRIETELAAVPAEKPVRVNLFCQNNLAESVRLLMEKVTEPTTGLALAWYGLDPVPGEVVHEGDRLEFRNLQLANPQAQLVQIIGFLDNYGCRDFACQLVK